MASLGIHSGRLMSGGEGEAQQFVDQKWPNQIFPFVNFVFSHCGHFGLGRGRGGLGESTPPLVFNYSKPTHPNPKVFSSRL